MTKSFPGDIPSYFADAEASFDESDIVLFGVPFDGSSTFRSGARFGPDAIRKASWNFEPYDLLTGVNIKDCSIHDYGDILIDEKDTFEDVFKKVTHFTKQVRKAGKIPCLLGGEHTETAASVKGFESNINVIVFDAHLDFRDSYVDESLNHACTIRRINDVVTGERIFVLGVRSADALEIKKAEKAGVHLFSSEEIQRNGIDTILSSMHNRIQHQPVYLSIDIDVLDPCYAPGTGTLEPFGLSPRVLLEVIDSFSSLITGFDMMEVAPVYDTGQTAILASKLIRYTVENICKYRKSQHENG